MSKIERVYMVTDMEGVACVDDWDPRHREYAAEAKGVYERSEIQRMFTGEVNAAAEALFAEGVTELVVNDAHGAGRTLLPEQLMSGIRLVRGRERPAYLLGCTPRFDTLVQVGMHPMECTRQGVLAHTMSPGKRYRINDTEVGEMELAAYVAGEMGMKWIFTSGDLAACRESERFVPNIVTAPVKSGYSKTSAIHMTPFDARALIANRMSEAIQRAGKIDPLIVEPPVTLEIEMETPFGEDLPPWAERISLHLVRYHGDSVWQVMNQHHHRAERMSLPEADEGLL